MLAERDEGKLRNEGSAPRTDPSPQLHTLVYALLILYVTLYLSRVRNIGNKNRKSFFKHPRYNRYLLYVHLGFKSAPKVDGHQEVV